MRVDFDYGNSKMRGLIEEYVHSERDRGILVDRYINGFVYERIAELHDMSPRQIQNIDYRFQQRVLVKHLDKLM